VPDFTELGIELWCTLATIPRVLEQPSPSRGKGSDQLLILLFLERSSRKSFGGTMTWQCSRLMIWLLLLWISPSCFGQVIRIRVVNGKNGQPVPKQQFEVSLLYDGSEIKPAKYDAQQNLDTDANGVAQLILPKPAPAHFAVVGRLTWQYWRCECAAPAMLTTTELTQKGIVFGLSLSAASVKAEPGEIVFVVLPTTFLERLFYPLYKE
jgi:hypothetical protein